MVAKFDQKQHERVAVVFATVDCEHELAFTADCCYDTERSQPLHSSDHVQFSRLHPTPLSFISLIQNTFVDVDNGLSFEQVLDIIGSCHLPLQSCLKLVVNSTNRFDLLV